MKHFLTMHGIDRPTAAEKSKADWRIESYLSALPDLRRERAEKHATQVCVLERELGRKRKPRKRGNGNAVNFTNTDGNHFRYFHGYLLRGKSEAQG